MNAYSTNDWMLGVAFRARYAIKARTLDINLKNLEAI